MSVNGDIESQLQCVVPDSKDNGDFESKLNALELAIKSDKDKDKTNSGDATPRAGDFALCCGGCIGFILLLGLLAGCISYLVFGIIFLVKCFDVANDCKDSKLWEYVLVSMVLSLMRSNAKSNSGDDHVVETSVYVCTLVCFGLIDLGLATWGGIELWENSCDELSETNLWKFGLATFSLQVSFGVLFTFLIPLGLFVASFCTSK